MSSCVEWSSHCFLALLFVPFTTKLDVPTVWLFGGFGEVVATHSQLYFLQLVVNTQVNSINSDVDIMLLRFIFLMIIILSSAVIFLTIGTNGLQAGTVCSLKQCLLKCLFKDTNVCCFCKNEKLVCRNFLQKLLPRLRKLGLLAVIGRFYLSLNTVCQVCQR